MKKVNKLFESFLFLIMTLILLIVSTVAWFVSFNTPEVNDFIIATGDFNVDVSLAVRKNYEGDFIIVNTNEDIMFLFDNAIPNDMYEFLITISNNGGANLTFSSIIKNISHENEPIEYDVRNVIVFLDGIIMIDDLEIQLQPNSTETEVIFGQELMLYRINNILDANNSIPIASDIYLPAYDEVTLSFILLYDFNTSEKGYQSGKILIESIIVYFNFA